MVRKDCRWRRHMIITFFTSVSTILFLAGTALLTISPTRNRSIPAFVPCLVPLCSIPQKCCIVNE
jgi:hypothetical protein